MKIKSITLQGFKSFVDRVHFTVPPGTSAIVGPNGCGKSNIVDAIRWVLGEHNARHLRGKLMEDLIFNGSDSRKRHGMAEVTITLSNDGGLAPARYAAFTEIEVKRRLYRSGESEYFINKVPSRLKDIVELFTDTGIGTNAYSIIEQGQVGWLVNAKPTERRVLFEEAAGINKYKQKKEASLRRLESTKDNLTRVSDIISEVKRQLNSLNRQAKKAERYKLFKEELKSLDIKLAGEDFSRLSTEYDSAGAALKAIFEEQSAIEAGVEATEARIETLRVERLQRESAWSEVREETASIERKIQAEEHSAELLRVRAEELTRNEARLTEELSELRASIETMLSEKERHAKAVEEAAGQLLNMTDKLTVEEAALSSLNEETRKNTEALRAEQAELMQTGARLSDIKYSIETCNSEERTLMERSAQAGAEREECLTLQRETEGPIEAARRSLAEAKTSKEALEAELSEAGDTLTTLEEEEDELTASLQELREESSLTDSRLKALEEMASRFEGLNQGVKAVMEAGKEGRASGILGLVADVIETEPGYEKAVEAVLGERLQYVIVESQTEGMEAVEFLKSESAGRGSFLPVRDLRHTTSAATAQGGPPSLADKVKVKDGYRGVVDYLFSNAVITNTLEDGRRLWSQNGSSRLFVTPDGDIIDNFGAITGGYSNGSNEGLLQKKRRMAELREKSARLRGEIEEKSGEVEALESSIEETRGEIDALRVRFHQADIGSVSLSSELAKHEEEFRRLSGRLSALDTELSGVRGSLEALSTKKRNLAEERSELESGLLEKEARSEALKEEAATLGEKRDNLIHGLTEIKVELGSTRERHDSIKTLLSDKSSAIKDAEVRLTTRSTEIESGRQERESAMGVMEEKKGILEELLVKKDATREMATVRQEALATLNDQVSTFERELRSHKDELTGVLEKKSARSIELKELELALNALEEKMADRYAMTVHAVVAALESTKDAEEVSSDEMRARATELREKIAGMGEVSLAALEEFKEQEVRYNFLTTQKADLETSVEGLMTAINKINRTTRDRFKKTFDEINEKFQETFPKFFNGGRAELRLSDETNILESGVEIIAQPPGKKLQNIMLLSGGEKALTATAFIFSVFLIKPSPFCLLDEVDAPLDDANVERFNSFVREMSQRSQFIVITHNKRTMEVADTLYGITMEEPGVSKVVSVKF